MRDWVLDPGIIGKNNGQSRTIMESTKDNLALLILKRTKKENMW
jgi:hypothetical protein